MEDQDPQNLPNLDDSETKDSPTQDLLEESKANPSSSSISENTPPKFLAWCSYKSNKVSIMDLETQQEYTNFDGAKTSDTEYSSTHVKEIRNTSLLISVHHNYKKSAYMKIFDISKKEQVKEIYSLGEVSGFVGFGDVTCNTRRNIFGVISLGKQVAYHLFTIDASTPNANDIVKLSRKSKWHPQYSTKNQNWVAGFDFNPLGEKIATIDKYGVCLISDVNTASYSFHLDLETSKDIDGIGRCRWSSNTGESFFYIKYDRNQFNIVDAEKGILILTNPVELEPGWTFWIDVCQINGNLVASGGKDKIIRIFDKRNGKIVKTSDSMHSGPIICLKWDSGDDLIASASSDGTVKLLDFKRGKTIHTISTPDGNAVNSVCFI